MCVSVRNLIVTTGLMMLMSTASATPANNGLIDDSAPGWVWSGMTEYDDPGLYGSRAHAGGPGGYGSFTFTGTGVDVVGVAVPQVQMDGHVHRAGSLKVSIDGKEVSTSTMKSATTEYKFTGAHIAGLPRGIHVLEVAPVGGWVVVDYIQVVDPSTQTASSDANAGDVPTSIAPTKLGVPVLLMNVGGGQNGVWGADIGAYGGTVASSTEVVSTDGMVDPAPEAVYQSERWGNFGYVVPNLSPGATYNVRLDFAETYYWRPTMRRFDVAINNALVLQDFDVFAAAGGKDKAVSEVFRVNADDQGRIAIAFIKGKADQPLICAIGVYKP